MKRFITVLISAGLLAGVVGCGGDGSESESSVDPAIAEAIDNIANDPEFPVIVNKLCALLITCLIILH